MKKDPPLVREIDYNKAAKKFCKEHKLPVAIYWEIVALAMLTGASLVLDVMQEADVALRAD